MRNILFEIAAVDPANGALVTLRACSASSALNDTFLDGKEWVPVITDGPVFSYSYWSDGQPKPLETNYGAITFKLSPDDGSQIWPKYSFEGAQATVWIGEAGSTFGTYRKLWSGATGPLVRDNDQSAHVPLLGSESALVVDLLKETYAGTGGAEGTSSLTGALKPFVVGACTNVSPILIDPVKWIYQVSTGLCAINAVYENALTLGAATVVVSTYAALAAATLADGQWAACPTLGMFRLKNEPSGKITADCGIATTAGEVMRTLILKAGLSTSRIDSSITNTTARTDGYYATEQVSILDVVRNVAFASSKYLITNPDGAFCVAPFISTKTVTPLTANRTTLPLVRGDTIIQESASLPAYKVRVGHTHVWSTHSTTEISPAIATITEQQNVLDAKAQAAQDDADQALAQYAAMVAANQVFSFSEVQTAIDAEVEIVRTDFNQSIADLEADDTAIRTTISNIAVGGGNFIPNTDLASTFGWTLDVALGGSMAVNLAGVSWHPVGENVLGLNQAAPTGSGYMEARSAPFAVRAGDYIQYYAFTASHRATVSVSLLWYNAAGTNTGYAGDHIGARVNVGGQLPANFDQTGAKFVQVPAGTAYAKMSLRKFDTQAGNPDSYAWFWRPYCGPATNNQTVWNSYSIGATGGQTLAKISDEATLRSNADGAIALRVSSIEADYVNAASAGTIAAAKVADEALVRSNADGALAGRATTIEARMATRPNIQINGGFENKTEGLIYLPASGGVDTNNPLWGTYCYHQANGTSVIYMPAVRVVAAQPYCVSFDSAIFASAGTSRVEAATYSSTDGSGAELAQHFSSTSKAVNTDFRDAARDEFSFVVPAGVNSIRLRLISENVSGVNIIAFRKIKVERGNLPSTQYTAEGSVTNAYARITDEALTRANAVSAVASRTSTVEASADTALNSNPRFSVTGYAGGVPFYWNDWSNGGLLTVSTQAGRNGTTPVRMPRSGSQDIGLQQQLNNIPAGWYVVEAEVECLSGNWQGSGVYVNFNNGHECKVSFGTTPDINEYVFGGNGSSRRAWSVLCYNAYQANASLYAMGGWSGFVFDGSSNETHWHKCLLRPATDGEIKGKKALGDVGALTSRVSTTESAITGINGKTAAYWKTESVAGNNRAQLSIWADANGGSGVDLIGDVSIHGNLLVSGSIATGKIGGGQVTSNAVATSGDVFIGAGATANIIEPTFPK